MEEDANWNLIAKYLANECSESERREVEANPVLKAYVQFFTSYLEQLPAPPGAAEKWDAEAALKRIHGMVPIPSAPDIGIQKEMAKDTFTSKSSWEGTGFINRVHFGTFARIAAVIIVLIGISYLSSNLRTLLQKGKSTPKMALEFSTGKGEQKQLILADGTKVTLNSLTKVNFSKSFGKRSREVRLEGEAFFVVAHHKLPFIVRTNSGTVEDVSTEFNVKAWPMDKETEVVVTKGKIILRDSSSPKSKGVVVTAGEMSKVDVDGILLRPVRADLRRELAWLDGSLIFDETPLQQVIIDLGRKYPFSFAVSDSSLLSRKLTASFKKEPLDEILKAIVLSLNMQYERKGDTIFLNGRTQRVVTKANK